MNALVFVSKAAKVGAPSCARCSLRGRNQRVMAERPFGLRKEI